jgi:hypothetical protein
MKVTRCVVVEHHPSVYLELAINRRKPISQRVLTHVELVSDDLVSRTFLGDD